MTSLDHLPADIIEEITRIVFEEADEKIIRPCDVIFVFGGSHPGLWEKMRFISTVWESIY
jgi:hypothetical protein